MEQKIINYIKANPNVDGIDIAHGLKISILEAYTLLGKLQSESKIVKNYHGVSTSFKIK